MRYFDALNAFLQQQPYVDDIEICPRMDKETTGNFEVTVVETGEKIHSAKAGQGRPDSEVGKKNIDAKIVEILKGM